MAGDTARSAPPAGRPGRVSSREIWALTWPQALMMLFQFLVGFVDVLVAGRIDASVQAALGLITQCLFFLLVIGTALANGGVAAMSQALGAGLGLRAERYIGLIFKVSAAFCLLTLVLGYGFRDALLGFLRVPADIYDLTRALWTLYLLILPCNYLTVATAAVFRSRKMVRVPLASAVVVCVVNAVLDYGLGLGYFGFPRLGAEGLIWSSILAVLAGGIYNLVVLLRRGIVSGKSFAPWRWERAALPYIIKVAVPSGGMQVLWQLGYIVLFSITATLPLGSVAALAGLTAGMRVEALLFLPGLAFNLTASVLVGHCLGAGNRAEARRVALRVIAAGSLSMTAVAVLLYPFTPAISAWIAPAPDVQRVAASYILFNLLAIPFSISSMIIGGIMTGAGATIYTFFIYGGATWLVRLPLAWYMGHQVWKDASGIFVAMLVSQVVQATAAFYVLLRCDWYRFASTAKRFIREKQ